MEIISRMGWSGGVFTQTTTSTGSNSDWQTNGVNLTASPNGMWE